ncbi:MAG TPA: hypothetical protein VGD46_09465 [Rhizobacter sp.]
MATQVTRPLPFDLDKAIRQTYVRPFQLVRMDFDDGPAFMSSGPQVVLENRLVHSEDLTQSAWTKTACTVLRGGYAPVDSALVLDKVRPDTSNVNTHYAVASVPVVDDEHVSAAVYAKRGEYRYARWTLWDRANVASVLVYDFDLGTFDTTIGAGQPDLVFETDPLDNGVVRFIARNFDVGTGALTLRMACGMQPVTPLGTFTGNGTDGTYYGAAQVWSAAEVYPYFPTGATAVAPQLYGAGQIDVGTMTWDPDAGQTGEIELFNDRNAAVAIVLANGVAEVPCTVYDCYLRTNGRPTAPLVTVKGVLTDSDITPTSAIVTVATVKAGVEYIPNRYCTPAEGFNWLPPDGAQVTWGGELYIFERE